MCVNVLNCIEDNCNRLIIMVNYVFDSVVNKIQSFVNNDNETSYSERIHLVSEYDVISKNDAPNPKTIERNKIITNQDKYSTAFNDIP